MNIWEFLQHELCAEWKSTSDCQVSVCECGVWRQDMWLGCVVIWTCGNSCCMNGKPCGSIQVTVFEMLSKSVGVYGCGYGVWG